MAILDRETGRNVLKIVLGIVIVGAVALVLFFR